VRTQIKQNQLIIAHKSYVISNDARDDKDTLREVHGLFTQANILARRFRMCSIEVKTILFKSFCMSFYGMVLWKYFTAGVINRLQCLQCFDAVGWAAGRASGL